MLINRIGKSEIQLYKNNSNSEPFEADGIPSGKKKSAPAGLDNTVHFETAKTVAGIASRYQVRNATAKEMASMSEELFTAGIITQDEHQALSYNRDFHFDYFDFAKKYPDINLETAPKRDFVQIWKETYSNELESRNPKKADTAEKIVNILENLDLVDAEPVH